MKLLKISFRLLIFLLIFGIALQISAQKLKNKGYKFESVSKGKVGVYGYTEVFQTVDRQIVIEGTGTRKTKKAAQSEFREQVRQSVKIIDSSKENKQNSRRIVLDLGGKFERRYLIVKYNGDRDIKYIAAENLSVALEFEKWNSGSQ